MSDFNSKDNISEDWLRNLINDLDIKISNVGIIITDDLIRMRQVEKLPLMNIQTRNIAMDKFYVIDINKYSPQYGVRYAELIITEKDGYKTVTEGEYIEYKHKDPLPVVVEKMADEANVIIRYIYNQRQAEMLSDVIYVAHSSRRLYNSIDRRRHIILVIESEDFLKFKGIPKTRPKATDAEYRSLIEEAITVQIKRGFNVLNTIPIEEIKGLTLWGAENAILKAMEWVDANSIRFNKNKIAEMKREYFKAKGIQIVSPNLTFDDVGGLDDIKEFVRNYWMPLYKDPETASMYGLTKPKGILLYGPPGTGKSWFAKALAGELNVPMLMVNASDFLGSLVGESERKTNELFDSALESNAIIFIDEIDQIGSSRARNDINQVHVNVLNIFLTRFQEDDVTVIGTTNRKEALDDAFIRRFDLVVEVGLPNKEARKQIFKIHVERIRPIAKELRGNIDYDYLATISEYMKPNEIEEAVKLAKYDAYRERSKLETRHIEEEVKKILRKIDISERKKYTITAIDNYRF